MPIYEYKCQQCGEVFEILIRRQSQIKNVVCSHCGSRQVEKLISGFACSGGEPSTSDVSSSSGCSTCSLPSCSNCK